ncbi:NAD-dependent epimerase/dehydratase family protein [Amycolatopsis sp. cmx-4-61]|uniref:NAD-dependent epimerase/dehydratase family protein n=1 Tax=Amycolatopsis sp. cmx-4-61 TaxID=2790937 RepID=UPI003978EE74
MKIFLTGATGYIGSVIAEKLLQAGHEVVGLARSDSSAEKLKRQGIEPHRGDLRDPRALTEAAQAADGVIQNAFDFAADFATAGASEANAVFTFIEALRGSGKPLVFTSGTGGLGDTGKTIYDEETPVPPSDSPTIKALQVRFDTEKTVIDAADVRGVVLRPPNVYGRSGGRAVLSMIRAASRKLGAVPYAVDAADNLWTLVHVDDLADLFVLAVAKAPSGELFHVGARSGLRTQDLAVAMSHGLGLGGRTVALERAELAEALGAEPLADYWSTNSQISGEKARRVLGWHPRHLDVLGELAGPSD